MKIILRIILSLILIFQFSYTIKSQCDVEVQASKNRVYHKKEKLYEDKAYENGTFMVMGNISCSNENWYLYTYVGTNKARFKDFKARKLSMEFFGDQSTRLVLDADRSETQKLDDGQIINISIFPLEDSQYKIIKNYKMKNFVIIDSYKRDLENIPVYSKLFMNQVNCILEEL